MDVFLSSSTKARPLANDTEIMEMLRACATARRGALSLLGGREDERAAEGGGTAKLSVGVKWVGVKRIASRVRI